MTDKKKSTRKRQSRDEEKNVPTPDVRVYLDADISQVQVLTSGTVAEVRDYRSRPGTTDSEYEWKDKHGRPCIRYFITEPGGEKTRNVCTLGLERFAKDLTDKAGVDASFEADKSPNGLHVLTINKVDYYFYADTGRYDGWGRCVDGSD